MKYGLNKKEPTVDYHAVCYIIYTILKTGYFHYNRFTDLIFDISDFFRK